MFTFKPQSAALLPSGPEVEIRGIAGGMEESHSSIQTPHTRYFKASVKELSPGIGFLSRKWDAPTVTVLG